MNHSKDDTVEDGDLGCWEGGSSHYSWEDRTKGGYVNTTVRPGKVLIAALAAADAERGAKYSSAVGLVEAPAEMDPYRCIWWHTVV